MRAEVKQFFPARSSNQYLQEHGLKRTGCPACFGKLKVRDKSVAQFWHAASELKKVAKASMQSNLTKVREKQLHRIVQKAVEIVVLGTNNATRQRNEKAVYTFLG